MAGRSPDAALSRGPEASQDEKSVRGAGRWAAWVFPCGSRRPLGCSAGAGTGSGGRMSGRWLLRVEEAGWAEHLLHTRQ